MVDDNSTTERVEASEGGQLHSNLILRLERKISQLEEEVANMRDLAKLSISLETQFGENQVTQCQDALTDMTLLKAA